MDKEIALEYLTSKDENKRLQGARFLVNNASINDEEILSQAIRSESVSWIRNALQLALKNIHLDQKTTDELEDININSEVSSQIRSIAVEETTRRLLHEIEPVIGALKVELSKEVTNYPQSKSKYHIKKLEKLMTAISKLSKSASSPKYTEFDLAQLFEELSVLENGYKQKYIQYIGVKPCLVQGDSDLISLIFCNGLNNAIESLLQIEEPSKKVIISWGVTDIEYWFRVSDNGKGLPFGSQNIWDIGSTTKKGHIGMGLPIAKQASDSLNGTIEIRPRIESGVVFEFRWPIK